MSETFSHTCIVGPVFKIVGETELTSNDVFFEAVFEFDEDRNKVKRYEWYLNDDLVIGINESQFSGMVACGQYTIGIRILSDKGWSGIQYLSFETCKQDYHFEIIGNGIIKEGSTEVYKVFKVFPGRLYTDVTDQYIFAINAPGYFIKNTFVSEFDNAATDYSAIITAVGPNNETLTLPVTITNSNNTSTIEVSTQPAVLVVDFLGNTVLNIIGFIQNSQFAYNGVAVYTGNNFLPAGSAPENNYLLASDLNNNSSAHNWRFQVNIAKIINDTPGITEIVFIIKGKANLASQLSCVYVLKTPGSSMVMRGSAGAYMPSVVNGSDIDTGKYLYPNVAGGANGNYNEANLNQILRFTYNVASKTLSIITN